jgi:hypothetical protein
MQAFARVLGVATGQAGDDSGAADVSNMELAAPAFRSFPAFKSDSTR